MPKYPSVTTTQIQIMEYIISRPKKCALQKEFEKVFKEAFEAKKPAVIDAEVDIDEMVLPMVPGGKPIYDMIMKLSEEVMN